MGGRLIVILDVVYCFMINGRMFGNVILQRRGGSARINRRNAKQANGRATSDVTLPTRTEYGSGRGRLLYRNARQMPGMCENCTLYDILKYVVFRRIKDSWVQKMLEFAFGGSTESSAGRVDVARRRRGKKSKDQRKRSIRLHHARRGSLCPNPKTTGRTNGGSKGFRSRQSVLDSQQQTMT